MKALSIWNPYALLLVKGYKIFETRTWMPPKSIIGQTIAIASTRVIRPEQRAGFADENFQRFYGALGLPDLPDLPHGYVLGTATLDSVELMTPEFMDDVSEEEKHYGWWEEGCYAWRMTNPVAFETPVRVRGGQGFYEWKPSCSTELLQSA
jgi:predicted transcriptional regulator